MREIYGYSLRVKYPHMSAADTDIWNRFIVAFPDEYERVQYDFHVGNPPPFNPLMENGDDLNQDMLYRLRIDVVGHNDDNIDIIEIKPNAGASVLGQVESYATLYKRDEEPTGKVSMIVITDRMNTNMEFLAKTRGIKMIIV